MAVTCANCGEELLGAVNRCWKCGTNVLSTPDAADAPPVRRDPVTLAAPTTDEQKETPHDPVNETNGEPDEIIFEAKLAATDADPLRGAPANVPQISQLRPTISPAQPAVPPQKPAARRDGWVAVAAYISLSFGLLAVGFGIFLSPLLIVAVAGLAAGIWALRSHRKSIATWGLVCCCLGMAVSGVRLAYDAFGLIYGDPPIQFAPADDGDGYEIEDDLDGNDPYGDDLSDGGY